MNLKIWLPKLSAIIVGCMAMGGALVQSTDNFISMNPLTVKDACDSPTLNVRVKKIISEQLKRAEIQVVPHARFAEELGADSLDMVEMMMTFEDEFRIVIPDADLCKMLTVDQAVNYLSKRLACAY